MENNHKDCFLCDVNPGMIILENPLAAAIEDTFPVSPGHTLVFPWRHVASWFDLTAEEVVDINRLVRELKDLCDEKRRPDGYNIGVNCGSAAGQTVRHVHMHFIPRFEGDVDDPTGGVRNVIPGRGNYLCGWGEP